MPEPHHDRPLQGNEVKLRLLATSDLHMHLLAYDYHADAPNSGVGLARVASLIETARAEVPGAVLLDNGDFLQGTPLGDFAAAERPTGAPHPMIAAMNVLGYDAVGLGNHEFDYGLQVLEKALADARFPVISANALRQRGAQVSQDVPLVRPWIMLERKLTDAGGKTRDLRIGVLSVLPPQTTLWAGAQLESRLQTRCMIETARNHVPALRAAGANIVVMLAHCGPSSQPEEAGMEDALLPLARIDGVDALIAGHMHRLLPGADYAGLEGVDAETGRVCGKPAVMPGIGGSHLGVIDLTLRHGSAGWKVAESRAELRPIARRGMSGAQALVADHAPVVAAVAADHAATLESIRRPVGETAIALQSYTSFLGLCPVTHAINTAQAWYVRQALGDVSEPVLSAAAPFKAGGPSGVENYIDIPPGPLSHRDLSAIYPFPNAIRAIRITGAELRFWLERSASTFNMIRRDTPDQALLDPAFPAYDFDVISGLEWALDLSRPALAQTGGRVKDLTHNGEPVADDQRFIVATNSYRLGGAGLHAPLAGTAVVLSDPVSSREVLVRFLDSEGPLHGPVPRGWRFEGTEGCEALFETGPGVGKHLGALCQTCALTISPEGQSPDGFARLRVRF
ncbi:bifunctional 2',3'-cyclic-nucleotide 2'-phosphodiesterase/3'-nucleotidase [Vannielia litorea]|uniref:bifunctional 2',3'-cyclic-nucleotide 2'-phosphodiesterase/3'-nucleotidase n=1 Tax=Vannielia litorea TaxID=1217970 RepID=UPI001C9799D7|nr:bifunctional 2',3'-cyclic-nucleotide 2'-phosphodiesterase/3'-nucleotidase [Vannielia litorea]MBY6155619.1 bifunctional 2',3'-cyclic-nucleotide 2'-phosphodiesterase/3'-nucleotidase [Vannielia litorea]